MNLVTACGLAALTCSPLSAQGFLFFPLICGSVKFNPCSPSDLYGGAYTIGKMNSILDHSMEKNRANNFWEYGRTSNAGADGVVRAFNGEQVNGTAKYDDPTCIGGTINLRPAPTSSPMTNILGCKAEKFASYDDHPGYDYKAGFGAPVYASASGTIVNVNGASEPGTKLNRRNERCINLNLPGTCASFGFIGIAHSNGYITQYGHLSYINSRLTAGARVYEGDYVGDVGHTGLPSGDHLHFEVLRRVSTGSGSGGSPYVVVDPYGWVGGGADPLYSSTLVAPRNLWK